MLRKFAAGVAGIVLASSATAQTVAEQKAQVDLDNARITELNSLRTGALGSNATSTVSTPAATAEAGELQDRLYDFALDKLIERFKASASAANGVKPVLVMGSSPPPIEQWLSFRDDTDKLSTSLGAALSAWKAVKAKPVASPTRPTGDRIDLNDVVGKTDFMFLLAAPLVLGAARSVLQNESAITGGVLKADDSYVGSLLTAKLKKAYTALDDIAPFLVGTDGVKDRAVLLSKVAGKCSVVEEEIKNGLAPRTSDSKEYVAAYQGLTTVSGDCKKLSAKLLTDQGGLPLATVIKRQQELAEGNYSTRPVFYVLSQNATLTTITNKNFLTGFGSTPANLSGRLRLVYLLIHGDQQPVGTRGMITCYSTRVKFDALGKNRQLPTPITQCDVFENGQAVPS